MQIKTHCSQLRTIKQDDPRFRIIDGFVTAPRAGFEISEQCPGHYKMMITQAIEYGWLKPVAHMTEREMIFMGLNNGN